MQLHNYKHGLDPKLHSPHDNADDSHDYLVEHLEEIEHDACLVAHLTNDDSERDAEHDDACINQRVMQQVSTITTK